MFIEDIDRKIVYNTQCKLDVINVFSVNETTQNLENIKVKLLLWICQNWLKLVRSSRKLTQIWLRFDSDMTQHLFSFLASSNQLLLSSR